MSKKINLFFKGIVDVLPLLIPVVPFGVIVGAIGIELGFTPLETYATSLIIFGGASQIVFLQLFSGGASSIITISSTFVVNLRHLLYGASLSEYLNKLTIGWKLLLSYLLTDQAYAVSNIYFEKNKNENLKHFYLLGSGFILWFIWQIFTIIGIFLGSIVPEELGLAYTIPLTFISLLVDRAYTATQYALLASIGTAGRTTLASSSGALVDWLNGDWGIFFILTAIMVIPSLIILWVIKNKLKLSEK